PSGAKIDVRKIPLGDNTLSVLEIWGAEYQEQNALLLKPEHMGLFNDMCGREKVPCAVIGRITGDGYIVLYDETDGSTPVNLDLKKILGEMPRKTFHLERIPLKTQPLKLPWDLEFTRHSSLVTHHYLRDCLERVLRLLSVGSKRFLTNKVDRSVTGLIARQQCCGSLQLTASDAAVIAQSHFGLTGAAISIGERPVLTLLNPGAMARMSVGEALTNIVWAKLSALKNIKCSGNWMWAAKLPGEGAKLYDAAIALSEILTKLGIAIDGGKDSLSMAAQVRDSSGKTEIVKSPGTLVVSAYATCPDITKVMTPDIKKPGQSHLMFIDLGNGKNRLGGSALAQVYNQIGNEPPDIEDIELLKRAFNAVQELIEKDLILSGHDRSDGGLIVTLLEMAFAGNCGIEAEINQGSARPASRSEAGGVRGQGSNAEAIKALFSEELGLVIEYLPENENEIISALNNFSVPHHIIGKTTSEKRIKINLKSLKDNENVIPAEAGIHRTKELDSRLHGNDELEVLLDEDMRILREIWEETSYQLERLQANPACADEEKKNIYDRKGPNYILSFNPENPPIPPLKIPLCPPLLKG
ncbi:MAG: AIR synthase-related protein, partial [Nitrospirota bacterium]